MHEETQLGEESPKKLKARVNNANPLPSLIIIHVLSAKLLTRAYHHLNSLSLKFFFARSARSIALSIGAAVLNT